MLSLLERTTIICHLCSVMRVIAEMMLRNEWRIQNVGLALIRGKTIFVFLETVLKFLSNNADMNERRMSITFRERDLVDGVEEVPNIKKDQYVKCGAKGKV